MGGIDAQTGVWHAGQGKQAGYKDSVTFLAADASKAAKQGLLFTSAVSFLCCTLR
jgi:hypothetical protein